MTDREKMQLAAAIKYKEMYEAEKAKRKAATRNEIFGILDYFPGRYVVLIGGSGSGKSYEIADRLIDRVVEEPKSRLLGVRAQRNQVSESQFPLLKSRVKTIRTAEDFKINESKGGEKIQYKTGAEIIFSGLDDVEKLKSIFDIT